MSLERMRRLARGEPEARDWLLQTCRLEGRDVVAYGREAILDEFARAPLELGRWLEAGPLAAGLSDDGADAVVATLVDGRVSRLWVLSAAAEPAGRSLPRIDVPIDLDLRQASAGPGLEPDEHPDLLAPDADVLRAALAWPREPGLQRLRPLVVRAGSTGHGPMALVRLEGESAGPSPRAVGAWALVLQLGGEPPLRILDRAGLAADLARGPCPRL